MEACELLCTIADRPDAQISASALAHFPGAGQYLLDRELLTRIGDEPTTALLSDHEDEMVAVSASPLDGTPGHFDPAVGWVPSAPGDHAVYRLNINALIARLFSRLTCSLAERPRTLIEGLVWSVGKASNPECQCRSDIWLVRRLGHSADRETFLAIAEARPSTEIRPVVALSRECDLPPIALRRHLLIGLDAVLDLEADLQIDPATFGARVAAAAPPISVAADGGVVRARGNEYRFTGSKHRAIIRRLYEAWLDEEPECLTVQVLDDAGFAPSVNTLAKAFSGRDDWKEILLESGGVCRLRD